MHSSDWPADHCQVSTQHALKSLFAEIERNEQRKVEQADKGFDGLTFFVYRSLLDGRPVDVR